MWQHQVSLAPFTLCCLLEKATPSLVLCPGDNQGLSLGPSLGQGVLGWEPGRGAGVWRTGPAGEECRGTLADLRQGKEATLAQIPASSHRFPSPTSRPSRESPPSWLA